jgi:hypothetical protein
MNGQHDRCQPEATTELWNPAGPRGNHLDRAALRRSYRGRKNRGPNKISITRVSRVPGGTRYLCQEAAALWVGKLGAMKRERLHGGASASTLTRGRRSRSCSSPSPHVHARSQEEWQEDPRGRSPSNGPPSCTAMCVGKASRSFRSACFRSFVRIVASCSERLSDPVSLSARTATRVTIDRSVAPEYKGRSTIVEVGRSGIWRRCMRIVTVGPNLTRTPVLAVERRRR